MFTLDSNYYHKHTHTAMMPFDDDCRVVMQAVWQARGRLTA
jgi:hypothetical protein